MQKLKPPVDTGAAVGIQRRSVGRIGLAMLVAVAIVMAFFHGWAGSSEAEELSVSNAISISDTGPQAPPHQAPPHSDHCLTHLVSDIRQPPIIDVAIWFAEAAYPRHAEVCPTGRTGDSPFKPPRA
jgi:hypothetical protein